MPHADMDIVSSSIHVLAGQSMDKFNSIPSNKFSAFEATDVCRNFQTSSKPSFYFRFITIMNVFLDIIMV